MPRAGFDGLCSLCSDVMNGMVDDVPPVFDVACIVHQVPHRSIMSHVLLTCRANASALVCCLNCVDAPISWAHVGGEIPDTQAMQCFPCTSLAP